VSDMTYTVAYLDERGVLKVNYRTGEEVAALMDLGWKPSRPAVIVPRSVPEEFQKRVADLMSMEFVRAFGTEGN
jgi:hypothetical protein